MPPATEPFNELKSSVENRVVHHAVEQGIYSSDDGDVMFLNFFHQTRDIARIRNEKILDAIAEHQNTIHHEGKDVIHGKRSKDHVVATGFDPWFEPGSRDGVVRDKIGMRELRAFCNTSCSTSVLEHRVILQAIGTGTSFRAAPFRIASLNFNDLGRL
jgi:hypothetical protein